MNKAEIIKTFGKNEKDTGSTAVQVALLTEKIKEMTEHLKVHKKDHSSRKGLLTMVSKRKKHLAYLKQKNFEQYTKVVNDLSIRH